MKKMIYHNLKKYTFDINHKGAHFTFNGKKFMNSGEFCEVELKYCFGLKAIKDFNTPFNEGSDIEKFEMSVKSSKATLTSMVLGNSFENVLKKYFEETASKTWAWVTIIEDTLTVYIMNKNEFKNFTENWSTFDTHRNVIRYKATSGKMIKWFEERI